MMDSGNNTVQRVENKKSIFICNFLLYSIVQFIILSFIAMYFYHGGNLNDPNVRSYDFTRNFLSDLGMLNTYSGESNIIPFIFFGISTITTGIGISLFANCCSSLKFLGKRGFTIARLGSIFGTIGGILFATVILLPWDLFFAANVWCINAAYFFISLFFVSLIATQVFNKFPKKMIDLNIIFLITILILLLIFLFGPRFTTPTGLVVQVLTQKTGIYLSLIIIFLQVYWMKKRCWVELKQTSEGIGK